PASQDSVAGSPGASIAREVTHDDSVLPFATPVSRTGSASATFFTTDASDGGAYLFVSANQAVDIFNRTGALIAALADDDGPQGLAVDAVGNLYVADGARVLVYSKGYKDVPTSLFDPKENPEGVAVDRKGNIGVTNIISNYGSGPGSVSFYTGPNSPVRRTISSSAFARIFFGAFDEAGNFFIDGENANRNAVVGEIVGGIKGNAITVLSTTDKIAIPGGILVNTKDNLVVVDQRAEAAYTYLLKGTKLTRIATTPLTGTIDPVGIALAPNGTDIYAADAVNSAAYEFPYLRGGSPLQTIGIPGSQPIGIAIVPSANP
ncbi:MAG: hypothetical protein IAI50_04990, partial [Candidatus Eremiobacteraeota bacterium]|nr:hypothetical protein [Candidatus Eremiobacteraeota bacterium]